jgi:uncharacterized protein YndB with AHSA1/START domain
MPDATNEIVIDRPPADVFAFLADPTNDPKWRTGVLDIAHESGTGAGARYRQGVKGPGGRRIAADVEITRFEPDSALGFRATAGPVRPEGLYELEPVDPGSTRVRFSLRAQVGGLKRLLAPMVQKTMNAEVGALERLKQVLEQRP